MRRTGMIPKNVFGGNVTPASSAARDAGLTRVVGPFALAATGVSLMVGAAVFVFPADLSRASGSLAPAVFSSVRSAWAPSGSALPDSIASVAPPPARAVVRIAAVLGSVGGISIINMAGIAGGARLVSVATVLKLGPLLLFLCAGVFAVKGANLGSLSMLAVIIVSPRGQILGLLALTAVAALLYLLKTGVTHRRRVASTTGPA